MTEKRLANSDTGPVVEQITNKQHIAFFQRIVNGFWRTRNGTSGKNFPGALPVSLETRDFDKLKKYEYAICEKTNGMRYFMFFTKHKDEKICLMVNRGFNFYKIDIPQDIEGEYWENTLFDGELVQENDSSWTFYIHDCVCWCGVNVSRSSLFERMSNSLTFVVEGLPSNENVDFGFKVMAKLFYPYTSENVTLVEDAMKVASHSTDGLIFTPVNLPVCSGTQYSMFKYKTREHHTFDFKVTVNETDDDDNIKICFFINDRQKLTEFMNGTTSDEDVSEFYEECKKLEGFKNDCILECSYDIENDKYIPVLVRTDKHLPNGKLTVQRTFVNIKENITYANLREILA